MRKYGEHCAALYNLCSYLAQRASKFDGWNVALRRGPRSITLILHSFYACVLPWIDLTLLASLDFGKVNVSQSRNYPAEREARPNPLDPLPPLCTGLGRTACCAVELVRISIVSSANRVRSKFDK